MTILVLQHPYKW